MTASGTNRNTQLLEDRIKDIHDQNSIDLMVLINSHLILNSLFTALDVAGS